MKYFILIISSLCFYSVYSDFRQENAKLLYSNPVYIKDAHVFTGRSGRNDSYFTNVTVTTLTTFGNNVSASINLQMISGGDFKLSHKLCDIMKEAWVINFVKAHSDLTSTCPFPPATYNMFNIVLPPKNMPIPMIATDYYITVEWYLTRTKESIIKIIMVLRFEETKWK